MSLSNIGSDHLPFVFSNATFLGFGQYGHYFLISHLIQKVD